MKKSLREKIHAKYNGHCGYCGEKIEYKDMQVDHILPKLNGRIPAECVEKFDNYMPACRLCNHYKRSHQLEAFRKLIATLSERLGKIYILRVALRFGIIKYQKWDEKFYFEKDILS